MTLTPDQVNAQIRYGGYAVWHRTAQTAIALGDGARATTDVTDALARMAEMGVEVRGLYDASTLRADADLMMWALADRLEDLQAAMRVFRRSMVGAALAPTWSAVGIHRPAEFNKQHVPAAFARIEPKRWLTVYPFVRSYEWYLLPEAERRELLGEHGRMGREYPNVLASTTSAFALGDYEWLLALEADDVHETVDLMRHLRASEARRHVRVETPFFTGRRIGVADLVECLR